YSFTWTNPSLPPYVQATQSLPGSYSDLSTPNFVLQETNIKSITASLYQLSEQQYLSCLNNCYNGTSHGGLARAWNIPVSTALNVAGTYTITLGQSSGAPF